MRCIRIVSDPEGAGETDNRLFLEWAEVPTVETVWSGVKQKDLVSCEHSAALPNGQGATQMIVFLCRGDAIAINQNLFSQTTDACARKRGDMF